MTIPAALREVPEDLIPSGLGGVGRGEREVAEVLFEQRRSENVAYCRTMAAVYTLHRVMYADEEAEYLASPGAYAEAVQARRRLSAAAQSLEAQVSTLLRVGSAAAAHAIEVAVGLVERIPQVFALVGAGVISPKGGEVALARSRVLTGEQARVFDGRMAERLAEDYEVLALPALREAADLLVEGIDPDAAERRRRAATQDRRVTFRPEEDGMAAVFALLPAHDVQEFRTRVDFIVGTVCSEDPRTLSQRSADGVMQLTRGYTTLGCQCDTDGCKYREARFAGEPDADGVVTRFIAMFHVVVNERDLAVSLGAASADAAEPAEAAPAAAGETADAVGAAVTENADAASAAVAEFSEAAGAAVAEPADPVLAASDRERPDVGAPGGEAPSTAFGYLVGHGPISAEYARELAARGDAKIRPFGQRLPESMEERAESRTDADSWTAGDVERCAHDLAFASTFTRIVTEIEHWGPWDDEGDEDFGGPGKPGGPDSPGPGGRDVGGPAPGGSGAGAFGDRGPEGHDPDEGRPGGDSPADGGPGPDAGPDRASPPGGEHRRPSGITAAHSADRPPGPPREPGALVRARGSAGYRPSADLRRYLRLVFPRCVFPHCSRPASRAQIDHRREYDHRAPELGGGTTADQIQPLCVAHHQLKTAGEWIDARLPDGRILWVSPDGRRHIVNPHGVVLELFPDLARIEWIVPERATPEAVAAPGGRTRLQREHARRERLRQRNIAALEAERARAAQRPSAVEDCIAAALGAPRRPSAAPSFDGPPPF